MLTMKKVRFLLLVSLMTYFSAQAQTVPVAEVFKKSNIVVGLGAGVPSRDITRSLGLPAHLIAEFALTDWAGAGPAFGFTYVPNTHDGNDNSALLYHVGARTAVHFTAWIDEWTDGDFSLDNIDIYALATPGLVIINQPTSVNPIGAQFRLGFGAGLRYYFSPRMGMYMELSGGWQSFVQAGISFKLRK